MGEYADLFKGIGKMKGVQVDLHVDPAILRVAQPHRRIPFSVRPRLEEELEKLMADDIIEKVDKPTSWDSPVEITLKWSVDEIQLNVEMREANKAIPCAYTVMATLDDIIHKLNGASVGIEREQLRHHHICNACGPVQVQETKFRHKVIWRNFSRYSEQGDNV